jgi:RimJ/RimL family protein N-acetyltransferase
MTLLSANLPSLVLPDGSVVEVRPLEWDDREALAAAVARLSTRSLYLRFASPKPRLTERDLDALMDIDHHHREALLAIESGHRQGIAVARYAEIGDEPGVVDIAVTVADEWQRRGLGAAMLRRVISRAREEGHLIARASVLRENTPSVRLVRHAGFEPRPAAGIMVEFELPLR